ncbi:MAG: permease prefix domain 2-containing transporter [Candidatus Angelobacter sp.]
MSFRADFVKPPRVANWLVTLFVAGEEAESLQGDMLEEYSQLASQSGVGFARSWYWRQTRKTIAHLVGTTFRTAPWLTTATVIAGFLLDRLVSGLPEQAIFAALNRYQAFEHHFSAYVFFATYGIAIGHVIASMFVGCAVALASKGREMVATMTLSIVFCAMTGAAVLVLLATGKGLHLWMLPWNSADWLAIMIGGTIVRMRRSTVTNLLSSI